MSAHVDELIKVHSQLERNVGVSGKTLAGGWLSVLEQWLSPRKLGSRLLDANREDFSGEVFHDAVDGKGPTLTIVSAGDGECLLGGFTPMAWAGPTIAEWKPMRVDKRSFSY
jgi:hypothetical protein